MVVKINIEDVYELLATAHDFMEATFYSFDKEGNQVLLKILIEPPKNSLLPNNDYERRPDGFAYFKPKPEPFDYQRPSRDLYRYYMFHLKT